MSHEPLSLFHQGVISLRTTVKFGTFIQLIRLTQESEPIFYGDLVINSNELLENLILVINLKRL